MRIPKWLHGWGRGTVAVRKSLSLATKGILDQGRGGKPQGRIVSFDKMYMIKGIKKSSFKNSIKLHGIRQYATSFIKSIKGKKTIKFNKINSMKAIKQFSFLDSSKVSGIKQTNFVKQKNIKGSKQYKQNKDINIKGISIHKKNQSYSIKGTKQISFIHKKDLKAKRDIRQLLIALGILGGCNE